MAGGPLLDLARRLIGVNAIISPPRMDSVGFVFVISTDVLEQIVPVLITEGSYAYAWLGLTGRDLNAASAGAIGLPPDVQGAQVVAVNQDGPADEAGLRGSDETVTVAGTEIEIGGDVVLAIDEFRVFEMDDIISYLVKETRPGQKVLLTILREGEIVQIEVTLGERPREP